MSSAGDGNPGPVPNAEPMSVPLSEDQRRTARAMAGLGVAWRQIAKYLRMDEAELAARLGDELEQAEMEANSKVAKALFAMATQKNNVAAAIFWMKARGGWREKHEIEATVQATQNYVIRVPQRPSSQEEWLAMYAPRAITEQG